MWENLQLDAFDRSLVDNGLRIRSVCKSCGTEIVESIMGGLNSLEAIHLKSCNKQAHSS